MASLAGVLNRLRVAMSSAAVPFVVGGSFALAARGYPRLTADIDVMVWSDGVDRIVAALGPPDYHRVNEVTFEDVPSGLIVDILPVEDDAQRAVFEMAEPVSVYGSNPLRVLTAEGCCLMLLREATLGDQRARPRRLRDVEVLAQEGSLDWGFLRTWTKRMGYDAAYDELRAEGKPAL